jgi:catechol-2,3-dioxygenase
MAHAVEHIPATTAHLKLTICDVNVPKKNAKKYQKTIKIHINIKISTQENLPKILGRLQKCDRQQN